MSGTKIDWTALLETADDIITKCEEFYSRDDPMTGIEELRGVEHAYYEALAEDTDKILRECEEECFPINTKVTPTEPIELGKQEEEAKTTGKSPVQGATQAPPDYPYEKMTPRAQDLYNKFKDVPKEEKEDEGINPENPEVEKWYGNDPNPPASRKTYDVPVEQLSPRAKDLYMKYRDLDAPKEEEAPIDAASVKEALEQAIVDATSLLQGLEEFVGKIEELDLKDIENALDETATVMTMIRYAKDGFGVDPETDQPYPPEEGEHDAARYGGDVSSGEQ